MLWSCFVARDGWIGLGRPPASGRSARLAMHLHILQVAYDANFFVSCMLGAV